MSDVGENANAVTWGRPEGGLALGLSAEGAFALLHLRNVGAEPLTVLSHVVAGGFHFDWYRLALRDADGNARVLSLYDERDESEVVTSRLAPGESLQHRIDIQGWASREVNGGERLAPGAYQMSAVYEAGPRGATWSGRLEAGPVALDV
jgi:hypothetical protein